MERDVAYGEAAVCAASRSYTSPASQGESTLQVQTSEKEYQRTVNRLFSLLAQKIL